MELVVLNLTTPSTTTCYVRLYVLLLVCLIGASAFVPPAFAAPPVWQTSRELIKKSPKSFPRLDQAGIQAVVKRLPKSLSLIGDYLTGKDAAVFVHKGDLTIDSSFDNSHTLVVDGNLTIRGSYDDYRDGIGILVVMGDLRVTEHVMSWGSIAVAGTLDAGGLVYAYYNDFTFEVGGALKARALVVFDKSANYQDDKLAVTFTQTDDGEGTALAVRHLVPEVMIEDVLDKTDAETTTLYAVASYEAARKRIAAGEPIFRDKPAPETLAADVLRLFAPKVDVATMTRLAKADKLLAMVVATKESAPVALQKQLAASDDPAILEQLAKNPNADKSVLAKAAATNAATASSVATNPNAPPEALASLAGSKDPAVRAAVLENAAVPVPVLSRLAADKDVSVRKALAYGKHLRRLPAADLARLIADPEPEVRIALLRQDAVLTVEQLAALARDKDPNVRGTVGEALSDQALWKRVPVGTPEARAAVLATILADAVPEVRVSALRGASPDVQEAWVDSLVPSDRALGETELAESTRNTTLMARAAEGSKEAAQNLAKNLAITPALQLRLIARLEHPKTRQRISLIDHEALSRQRDTWDAVIEELLQNPNMTAEAELAVAKYCRAASAWPLFCDGLLDRRGIAPVIFDTLSGVGDSEEWALAAILSHHATRAHLERAVPRWYDDEPEILAEFKKLRSLQGAAWWNALAASKRVKLREIAAHNAATPPATLVTLIKDPEGDVAGGAAANPSTPLEALTAASSSGWPLANPSLPDALVHSLLDRALREGNYSAADHCKKVLAARALRAKP